MSAHPVAGNREAELYALLGTSSCLLTGLHRMCVRPCSPLRARRLFERFVSGKFGGERSSNLTQAGGNLPTVDPEHGELRTLSQLVSDVMEVCKRLHSFLMALTCVVGTPPLLILPCHGSICFACYPNTSGPPLPTLISPKFEHHPIKKEFGMEVKPRGHEIRFRFSE